MSRAMHLSKKSFFDLVHYEPHAMQLAVHRSRAPRRILCTGVRAGKTKCAAMEALAAAMEPKKQSVGWVVAPTYDLAERVYREIVVCTAEHLRHRIITLREHDKRLVLRNVGGGTSEIRAKSADNVVSLLGEGCDWIVCDEAARLRPIVWESHLSQRLIDRKGWALLLSTPRGKGWLHSMWLRGQQQRDPDYESWNFPSWCNPRLDRALIEAERQRLPERVFAQEYGGEFIEGSGQVLRNVRECATGEWQDPVPGEQYFAGLDLARIEDYTVLTIMNRRREVVFVDRCHRIDWNMQVLRVKAATDRYNRAQVLMDASGIGDPLLDNLRRAGINARPFKFSSNSKRELVDALSVLFEKKQITLPRYELCPVLVDECEGYAYTISDSGTVRTEAPSGTHDDAVVSLGLCCWQLRRDPAPLRVVWV